MKHHYQRRIQEFLEHRFPAFVVGTLGGSLAIGWVSWSLFKRNFVIDEIDAPGKGQRARTLREAQLQAMIENAASSTWQENLDNAMQAQTRFMLPNRRHSEPAFVRKIDERSREILRQDETKTREDEQAQKENHFWK